MTINLSYVFLSITVLTTLFTTNRKLMVAALLLSQLIAFFEGVINGMGAFFILILFVICYLFFNSTKNFNIIVKGLLWSGIAGLTGGFMFHKIPGFNNLLAIGKMHVSPLSTLFSMYLNFDKVMAALVIYITSNLCIKRKFPDKRSIWQTINILTGCVLVILGPALLAGQVRFDFKIPSILPIWAVNNLLFVCFGEEVIFRGFLQSQLKSFFSHICNIPHLHLFTSSILFGIMHFQGGILYVLMTAIAGGFYGYAYEKTNRLSCAILVHFGLNLIHLLFFTYPAAIYKP